MDDESQESTHEEKRAGIVRTWWHPLLVRLLRYSLGSAFQVHEEVSVGEQPLRIDVLLLRKSDGVLTDEARRLFPELVDLLSDYTYIEFKGPTDSVEIGDYEKALGVVHLHRCVHAADVPISNVTLLFIVPKFNKPFQRALKANAVSHAEVAPGCVRIDDGRFQSWCLETGVDAGVTHPVLSMLSPTVLKHDGQVYHALTQAGFSDILGYIWQLIRQFSSRPGFAEQHTETDEMVKIAEELMKEFLESLTPEERLEGLSPVERLEGLSPVDRVQDLSLEERLAGLPREEIEKLPLEWRKRLLKENDKLHS